MSQAVGAQAGNTPATHNARIDLWLTLFFILAAGWAYLGSAWLQPRSQFSLQPDSYYGLLAEALLAGQTNLKVPVDPKLLQLANPYAGPQGAMSPHDMSFYRGKFYLYYGITPALLLYAPVKAITGRYLAERTGIALFCWGAFGLGAWWLFGVKRRLFPHVAPAWFAMALAVFAFGTPVLKLAHNATFYGVPIACAVACLMATLLLASRALLAASVDAQAAWLAGASLAGGLAVGARPDYVLALPALLLPAVMLWRALPRPDRWRWLGGRVWLAALVPAALVGLGLALYNYLRFDDPFDFGIRYSMASGDLRHARLMGTEFIGKNLRLYLLHSADWVRYCPFVINGGGPVGLLAHFPLAALATLFPLTLLRRNLRADRDWLVNGGLLLVAFAANLFTLCLFFGETERYLADYAPAALLLGVAALLALADTNSRRLRLALPVVTAVALFTLFNGVFLALPSFGTSKQRLPFERALNWPTSLVERATGEQFGPLALQVRLPHDRVGRREPLLVTGSPGLGGDIVYLDYVDAHHLRVGFFHLGAGGPQSDPVEIDYSQPHAFEIWLGSLLPPSNHPAWGSQSPAIVAAALRRFEVRIDGKPVLRSSAECYFSTPGVMQVGTKERDFAPDVCDPGFTGEILNRRRLGLDAATPVIVPVAGPLRLHLRFPTHRPGGPGEPLISTGHSGAGDLLYVTYLADGRLRFGLDDWNLGQVATEAVSADPTAEHILDVDMGSLHPIAVGRDILNPAPQLQRFVLMFDGRRLVDTTRQFNASSPDQVELGFNAIRSSAADAMFTGTILSVERVPNSIPAASTTGWGPLRLSVRFPNGRTGLAEPLLVTGRRGAADILYVVYVDSRHVRFGVDHWGVGGAIGDPVELDYDATQSLELTLGSLYPAPGVPEWQGHDSRRATERNALAEVRLDGRVVFSTTAFPAYHEPTSEISIGKNSIGASSCGERFTGETLLGERLPW